MEATLRVLPFTGSRALAEAPGTREGAAGNRESVFPAERQEPQVRTEACPSTAKETLRLSRVQKRVVERGGVAAWLEEKGVERLIWMLFPAADTAFPPGLGPIQRGRDSSSPRASRKSDDEVNRVVSSRALDVLLKKDTTGPKRSRWSEACIPKPRLRPKLTTVSSSPRKVILHESIWNRLARARVGQTTGQTDHPPSPPETDGAICSRLGPALSCPQSSPASFSSLELLSIR